MKKSASVKKPVFELCGHSVEPGSRRYIEVPLPPLYTHGEVTMPVHVINGRREGPVLLLTAAIHGDEINGIEIIRRVLANRTLDKLRGTLVAVPVVNVFGFIAQSRYLPDRRDLNRMFPGSERGSMASRLADLLVRGICSRCTHAIDLHTAAAGRDNLPQIRYEFGVNTVTHDMALAFAAPVILNSTPAEGTLRHALPETPLILYEAGEALRFDEVAIKAGTKGIFNVMRHLGMLTTRARSERRKNTLIAEVSSWLRAPQSGMLRSNVKLGAIVATGQPIGMVSDPFGESDQPIYSHRNGVVVGKTNLPLVHEGEALFHIADFGTHQSAEQVVSDFVQEYKPE